MHSIDKNNIYPSLTNRWTLINFLFAHFASAASNAFGETATHRRGIRSGLGRSQSFPSLFQTHLSESWDSLVPVVDRAIFGYLTFPNISSFARSRGSIKGEVTRLNIFSIERTDSSVLWSRETSKWRWNSIVWRDLSKKLFKAFLCFKNVFFWYDTFWRHDGFLIIPCPTVCKAPLLGAHWRGSTCH